MTGAAVFKSAATTTTENSCGREEKGHRQTGALSALIWKLNRVKEHET